MFDQIKKSRVFSIFTTCIFLLTMASPASVAPVILSTSVKTVKADEAPSLLQYAADGHMLGFDPSKVYFAGLDHALTVEFIDGSGATPIGKAAAASIKAGSASALERVTYKDAWPDIDVIYTATQSGLVESTYILQPGARPTDIRLKYNTPVQLMQDGTLHFAFETGRITESAPIAWQEIDGKQLPVDVHFKIKNSEVSFELGPYNPEIVLTIDPTYVWHTFYGSSDHDAGNAIASDGEGNIYVAGLSTATWNGPNSTPPLHTYSGNGDIVIVKLNRSGVYQWHTFYGSSATDYAYSITSDTNGNIYMTGNSDATWNGPSAVAPLHSHSGQSSGADIVVLKLNNAGIYEWHTFYGSSNGWDYGYAITTRNEAVYIAGYSYATWSGPTSAVPLNAFTPNDTDIVILKLNSSGIYQWHTFYGSANADRGNAITSDGNGNIYITGRSGGVWNGPDVTSPLRGYLGNGDIVVIKLNESGTYQWHTFYGSTSEDTANAIVSDQSGNLYVAGISYLPWNGPSSTTPLNAHSGSQDIAILKLNSSGTYQWHTFYGSSTGPFDMASAIARDTSGNIYVTGYSQGTWNGPNTALPLSPHSGNMDINVVALNSLGLYQWHTFGGSSANDYGNAIVNLNGSIYIAGESQASWNGPGPNFTEPLNAYRNGDIVIVKGVNNILLPNVTLNRAISQSDPTSASSINFTATFSKPINTSTFTNADITLDGTASGALSAIITQIAPNDDTTFNIAVSGMTGSGTVTVSISASKVTDLAGNPNTASTSADNSVTYILPFCSTVTQIPQTECEALEALYNSSGGPNWSNHANWLETSTPGNWYGVVVFNGYVDKLLLSSNNLNGTIPSELGNLSQLTELNLEGNELSGEIPSELGNWTLLKFLHLNDNDLSEDIPSSLGSLTQLEKLQLGNNSLSGDIPPELGSLTQLEYLHLFGNDLSGSIPSELGSLPQLTQLHMEDNELSGNIPPQLGSLTQLTQLKLGNNELDGNIPPELGNLTQLTHLFLYGNQLDGNLPFEIGNLSNLQVMGLQNNQLTGEIPTSITNLTNLIFLHLECTLTSSNPVVITFVSANSSYWNSCPVISGNAGVDGAILSIGSGAARTAAADANGDYIFTVYPGWSGPVTPAKTGYTFSPPSETYSNVTADQAAENYTVIPSTIDPALSWNSFLGGGGGDVGRSIAADNNGNVYVVGYGDAAWGSPMRTYTASNDAFVAKMDASGNLIWNTFLGGSGDDEGRSIAVDDNGNVFVAGFSSATWGSPMQAHTTGNDAFIAKLNSSTGNLTWNTFLGGNGDDRGFSIALDNSGNAYVTGFSSITWGSPVQAYIGNQDAFVARLSGTGSLTWNTFLGGGSTEQGHSLVVDGSGNIYVAGLSGATWGTPVRAHNTTEVTPLDAFAAKINPSGNLTWSTFLGGNGTDQAYSIAVDDTGNVYVTGDGDATWGSPVRAYAADQDAFAAKLDGSGNLVWNTFLGVSGIDYGTSIAVNAGGNVYVGGESSATWGSPTRAYTALDDAFAAKLESSTGNLTWNTFLGGSGSESGYAITVDDGGNVYAAGVSYASWGSPVRAYNTSIYDAFIAKLDFDNTNTAPLACSTPQNISNTAGNSQYSAQWTEPFGIIHTVWEEEITSGNWVILYRKMAADGTWEPVETVSTLRRSMDPTIVGDSNGTIYVAWAAEVTNFQVYYAFKPVGGAWSATVQVTNATIGASGQDLAVKPDGTLYLAYYENNSSGQGEIYLRAKAPGGAWFASEQVATTLDHSINPSIAVDSLGNLQMIWLEDFPNGRILASSKPVGGSSWLPFVQLSTLGELSGMNDLAVDSQGTFHAVWDQGNSQRMIYYANLPRGGSWSASTHILDAFGIRPVITVDTQDTLRVSWGGLSYAWKSLSGTWFMEQQIAQADWYGNVESQSGIGSDAQGNIHFVWNSNPDGNAEIWHVDCAHISAPTTTPTATPTPTSTSTGTPTPTRTYTPTITPTQTKTLTPTPSVTVDSTAPTVVINQALGQADPTTANLINFTVVFSEPINVPTFTPGDITLSGTAGATTAIITEIAPHNGTTFNLAVGGMTHFGTVAASLAAGRVSDAMGNLNAPSASSDNVVTYDEQDTACQNVPTIASGQERFGSLVIPSDIDPYLLTVTSPYTTIIATVNPPAAGDFTLTLFQGCDTQVSQPWDIGAAGKRRIHIGDGDETVTVLFNVGNQTGPYYLVVSAAEGGEYSPEQYRLHLLLQPPNIGQVDTLFLYNPTRFRDVYGLEAASQTMDKLMQLADHTKVHGTILQLDQFPAVVAAYDYWDDHPTSVAAANAVSESIRSAMLEFMQSTNNLVTDYVVLIGDDHQIPFRRLDIKPHPMIGDANWLSEESYPQDHHMAADTPLAAAMLNDQTLSDDFYGNYRGLAGVDFLSSFAVGRLLDTPTRIQNVIDFFLTHNGEVNLTAPGSSATVVGYSFLADSAQKLCDHLFGLSTDCSLVGPPFTRDQLISKLIGNDAKINVYHGHTTDDTLLDRDALSSLLTAQDIQTANLASPGSLWLVIGCHSGLVWPGSENHLSLAQALADHGGTYLGNTGWTWGSNGPQAYSELLYQLIAERLRPATNSATIGEALRLAKRDYFYRTIGNPYGQWKNYTFSHYDRKVMSEATLYGLPMLKFIFPAKTSAQNEITLAEASPKITMTSQAISPQFQTLSFTPGELTQIAYNQGGNVYYTGQKGEYSTSPKMPLLPQSQYIDFGTSMGRAKGVIWKGGHYNVIASNNPLVINPTVLNGAPSNEPAFNGTFPLLPVALVGIEELNGAYTNRLTFLTAQYMGTQTSGSLRLFTNMDFMTGLWEGASSDEISPIVGNPTTTVNGNLLHIQLPVTDASGVYKVLATYTVVNNQVSTGSWQSVEQTGTCSPGQQTYNLDVPLPPTGEVNYFIQVMDCAGNVSVKINNEQYYKVYTVNFSSAASQDGWVLESTEKSSKGGTLNANAVTFNLGDDKSKKQYLGILSFSTGAGLPDDAIITGVTLKVKKQGITGGGNPLTTFQGFMVDIKNGFFGAAALQSADFQTAASASYGPFKPAPASNWYSIDLTGAGIFVNKLTTSSGLTQIRLRFKLDDNNNALANYLSLYSGNAPAASRPQLVITYTVP